MSFLRLIYYGALVGGWAAFLGWFLGEAVLMHRGTQVGLFATVATTALCGALIACGLSALEAFSQGKLAGSAPRLVGAFAAGLLAGVVGAFLGDLIVSSLSFAVIPRALGFTIMGLAIGGVNGLLSGNRRSIRNGLIGGALGGLIGGLLFEPLLWLVRSPMSSRAFALVLLGLFIGLFIGLVQVLFRDAWLTVEAGFRPGRQLMLSGSNFSLGTAERSSLVFIAQGAQGVEPTHVQIEKQRDGSFWVRDNRSRSGTYVNGLQLSGPVALHDGDTIRFGVNTVRFNERMRAAADRQPKAATIPVATLVSPAAPVAAQPVPVQAKASPIPMGAPVAKLSSRGPSSSAPPKAVGNCPHCGSKVVATASKRYCENCGAMF